MEELTKAELIAINYKQEEKIAELTARVAELEARLEMNSKNSSKPPSTDGLAKPTVNRCERNRAKTLVAKRGTKDTA